MKKILALLFLVTSFVHAQFTIKGTMTPPQESDWVILYKIEGAKQIFVQNTNIKIDSVTFEGKKQAVGNFNFTLPKNSESGFYRAAYKLEGAGFVDFIFNKENVSFVFNPQHPESVVFSESKENILYKKCIEGISKAQQELDSIQITALKNPSLNLKTPYIKAFNNVYTTQKHFLNLSKNSYSHPFIKASLKRNPSAIITSSERYMSNRVSTFFDNIDFSNKKLLNSSFLVDKITEYIFYLNYSEDKETQYKLHKKAIETVFSKLTNLSFKKDLIEFLITQFEASKNLEIIDYLFENHYNKLPQSLQDNKFKQEKLALLIAEVGRIAPDFSWKENGKTRTLSQLNNAENYILIFWSTSCSHCLREIPELYAFMKGNTKTKVIAFALEKEAFVWENYKINLLGWHNVLGLGKWENKIARTYQIFSTPSYFILDTNKKIIAKPEELKDVKQFFSKK
ncbi:MAG: TlpA family protein disulfide reductase [Polaribacter sp.]